MSWTRETEYVRGMYSDKIIEEVAKRGGIEKRRAAWLVNEAGQRLFEEYAKEDKEKRRQVQKVEEGQRRKEHKERLEELKKKQRQRAKERREKKRRRKSKKGKEPSRQSYDVNLHP